MISISYHTIITTHTQSHFVRQCSFGLKDVNLVQHLLPPLVAVVSNATCHQRWQVGSKMEVGWTWTHLPPEVAIGKRSQHTLVSLCQLTLVWSFSGLARRLTCGFLSVEACRDCVLYYIMEWSTSRRTQWGSNTPDVEWSALARNEAVVVIVTI